MFGFSNKKKKESEDLKRLPDDLKGQAFNNNVNDSSPEFDIVPPPPGVGAVNGDLGGGIENKSLASDSSLSDSSFNRGAVDSDLNAQNKSAGASDAFENNNLNSSSSDESLSGDVDFEIPDFTEDDLNLNVDLSGLDKGETEKSSLDNANSELSLSSSDSEDIDFSSDGDFDASNLKAPGEPDESEDDLPGFDVSSSIGSDSDEGVVESGESDDFAVEGGDLSGDSFESNVESNVESGDVSVESGESDEFAVEDNGFSSESSKVSGEVGGADMLEESEDSVQDLDDKQDLPYFDVSRDAKPKFISKPEYKKLITNIMDAGCVAKELLDLQGEFPKIELNLKKQTSVIDKDILFFKESLINIDKKIFSQK
ncbi:MAG: hypothetical protein ACLFN8_03335 [Candidatus Woesearchaeota archaeon]